MITRLPDWPRRLELFFAANLNRRFVYGQWDCCLMALAAIEAMTGKDLAVPYRGTYHNRDGAYNLIKRETGKERSLESVVDMWRKLMLDAGIEEKPPSFAQRGSPVAIRLERGASIIGICGLDGRPVVLTRRRMLIVPRQLVISSWRV